MRSTELGGNGGRNRIVAKDTNVLLQGVYYGSPIGAGREAQ